MHFKKPEQKNESFETPSEKNQIQEFESNLDLLGQLLDDESIHFEETPSINAPVKSKSKLMRRKSTITTNSDEKYFTYNRYENEGEDDFILHEHNTKQESEEDLESKIHESLLDDFPVPGRVNSNNSLEQLREINERFTLKEIINMSNQLMVNKSQQQSSTKKGQFNKKKRKLSNH
jgi:hypothetical protein